MSPRQAVTQEDDSTVAQDQCQQQQASIRSPKTWQCPETWDLPMLNLDLPVDPWAPTKLFPF